MYQLLINRMANLVFSEKQAQSSLRNIKTVSDLEIDYRYEGLRQVEEFKDRLESYVKNFSIKVLILDNFSTSVFSDSFPNVQAKAFSTLKKIANSLDIAVLVLIHPVKGAGNKLELAADDIRGNSAVKNIASYIYILKNCFNVDPKKAFIKVEKSRNHGRASGKYFEMDFEYLDSELGYYKSDKLITRNNAIEQYKLNNS